MKLNITKCQVLTFTKKINKIQFDYSIQDEILARPGQSTYLGVIFSEKCSPASHISQVIKKANSALYFIRRVFSRSSPELKEKVYLALVRSKLEYASSLWDPHQSYLIDSLEMVQRRAARFVINDYGIQSSVTDMLSKLNWDSLETRRKFARLKNFYLVYNGIGGWIDLMEYVDPPARTGRAGHACSVRTQIPRTDLGKFSYITRSVNEWNSLPADVFMPQPSFGAFKSRLRNHLFDQHNE